jgi:hypothetical protein
MIIYLKTAKMLSATLAVKPVGKSDARNRLVQSDERRWETERWPRARPLLHSTRPPHGHVDPYRPLLRSSCGLDDKLHNRM